MPDEQPFANSTDVANRWRALTSEEDVLADTLCADASDMIRERFADVDSRVAQGTLRTSTLERIVATMVKRAMSVGSREGVDSSTDTAGPFGRTLSYTNPNANLYLSRDDLRSLGRRRAFAVDL